jgi:hypothetical protein
LILIVVLIAAGGERSLEGAWWSVPAWKSSFVPSSPFGGRTNSADARKHLVHSDEQSNDADADLIIYGATPSGITAAIEAANLGHSVILLEPTQHVGGMMSNGLGSTDVYGTYPVGGLPPNSFKVSAPSITEIRGVPLVTFLNRTSPKAYSIACSQSRAISL